MSNACCKVFTGWCKSFTRTEVFLCVLQAIFLVVFIVFLTFLILHLVVCSRNKQRPDSLGPVQTASNVNTTEKLNTDENPNENGSNTDSITKNVIHGDHVTDQNGIITQDVTEKSEIAIHQTDKIPTTLDKRVKCTWKPSQKTNANTHYYEYNQTQVMTTTFDKVVVENLDTLVTQENIHDIDRIAFEKDMQSELEDNRLLEEFTDGKEIYDFRKDFLLALVKIKPPQEITFGCTLTIVSEYWTLTAASCIKAIEEVDSLDSFVMMHEFKEEKQNIHHVTDVMIQPQYQGVNLTHDLALLKSETSLVKKGSFTVTLPSMVDYFLITIGESLTVLGYGRFRNLDKNPLTRTVREVSIHSMPLSQCAPPRHLTGGACGTSPICAGVLRSRTSPCNYCSGTPLLNQNILLGIMSDNRHCGLSCEPALFVNLALVRDWLRSVLSN